MRFLFFFSNDNIRFHWPKYVIAFRLSPANKISPLFWTCYRKFTHLWMHWKIATAWAAKWIRTTITMSVLAVSNLNCDKVYFDRTKSLTTYSQHDQIINDPPLITMEKPKSKDPCYQLWQPKNYTTKNLGIKDEFEEEILRNWNNLKTKRNSIKHNIFLWKIRSVRFVLHLPSFSM